MTQHQDMNQTIEEDENIKYINIERIANNFLIEKYIRLKTVSEILIFFTAIFFLIFSIISIYQFGGYSKDNKYNFSFINELEKFGVFFYYFNFICFFNKFINIK